MRRINFALAILGLLTACGAPSAAQVSASASASVAAQDQAAWQACTTITGPMLRAIQNIQGQVSVGVTFDNYGPAVGQASTAAQQMMNQYDSGAATKGDTCATKVAAPLVHALQEYSGALDTWNTCIQNNNPNCTPAEQDMWTYADGLITSSTNSLAAMQPKP